MRSYKSLTTVVLGFGLVWGQAATAQSADSAADDSKAWTPIDPSDRVIASAWGEETALLRQAHLLTWPGTEAQPGRTSALYVGRNAEKIPVQTVRVLQGRVDAVLVPSTEERGVLLAGPNSISAIANRGRVSMSVTRDKVYVQALRHDALVGYQGIFKKLTPGTVRSFERRTGDWEDMAPVTPPRVEVSSPLALALDGETEMTVRASSVGDVCVALQDENGKGVGPSQCGSPGSEFRVHVPRAGSYRAIARSLGPGDLESALSEGFPLRVIGLADENLVPEEGVLLLKPGERVQLLGTEGLEMRVGTSDEFVAATSSFALAQGGPTVVEFRQSRAPDERVQLRLAPRIGKITTSVGPKMATWPGKPIRMQVAVRDGIGRLLDQGKDLRLEVYVDAQQVETKFQNTSGGLVGYVSPVGGYGPWVVRLNVYDADGRMIARDFVEVVRSKKTLKVE